MFCCVVAPIDTIDQKKDYSQALYEANFFDKKFTNISVDVLLLLLNLYAFKF